MKRKSVWQRELTPEDWDFSSLDNFEVPLCHEWEFTREKWQRENGGLWPVNPNKTKEHDYDELPTAEEIRREMFALWKPKRKQKKWRHWSKHFPKSPFLRVRTVYARLCHQTPQPVPAFIGLGNFLECDIKVFLRRFDADAISNSPKERPLFDPLSGHEVVVLQMPWSCDDEILKEHFDRWLRQNRPAPPEKFADPMTIKQRQRPRGNKSEVQQLRTDLKALGAVRLWERYGTTARAWAKIVDAKREVYFKKFYSPSEFTNANGRVEKTLASISV